MADLATTRILRQRQQLEETKRVGHECETMANDIKVNLQGQTFQLKTNTLKNLLDIQD